MLGTAEGAFGGVEPGEPLSAALVQALSCCADHIGRLNGCRSIYFARIAVAGKRQRVERAGCGVHVSLREMEIDSGLFQFAMPR